MQYFFITSQIYKNIESNKQSSVRCRVLHRLHKDSVYTDCEYGDSQADPSFVSVAQGEFTAVKLMSCIWSELNT